MRRLTDRQRKAMFAKRSGQIRGLVTKRPGGEELLAKHEGLVKKLAGRFVRQYPTVERDDLLQEGRLGLLRAGDLYKKRPGAKFSTYASHHILKRMREMAQSTLHALHVPERKLRSGKGKFTLTSRGDAGLLGQQFTSGGIPKAEALGTLKRMFKKHLTKTEQEVLYLKHLNGQLTVREISKRLKKPASSVHALERAAFAKLRRASLVKGRRS